MPASEITKEMPQSTATLAAGIAERQENGLTILSPANGRPVRRVVYVNSYGGGEFWHGTLKGECPGHHLWGCIELARMGYEVALAEPLKHFSPRRKPLPHDLRLLRWVRDWLGKDGILYCGHTLLYWIPFLKKFKAVRCRIVSLVYAREQLDFARQHDGIIALTPAAAENAKKLAPQAKIVHLGWGADLTLVPSLPYQPEWFLSCGKTHRDHRTLSLAAERCRQSIKVISPDANDFTWPPNVKPIIPGKNNDVIPYLELLHDYYARCAASLIILKNDPVQDTAVGMTNLIEAMSMARPVIVTRTGALATEIDVEKAGCGLHVPAENPDALAEAIETLANNPDRARAMGETGRQLAESRYNIDRYGSELHKFFQSL